MTNEKEHLITYCDGIEPEALEQIRSLAESFPFRDSVIRIMPDAHAGKGCTVGTTMTIRDKVTPNLVGVDIGCGMRVVELGPVDVDPTLLQSIIEQHIPSGMNVRSTRIAECEEGETLIRSLLCFRPEWPLEYLALSVGTLGGGNHFIELNRDDKGNTYLVIHSGSRNLGVRVCKYYQDLTKKLMVAHTTRQSIQEIIDTLKAEGRSREIQGVLSGLLRIHTGDDPLGYLEGEGFDAYLHDMEICQRYAALNRSAMARIILEGLGLEAVEEWETVHNYIDLEHMILRKGAISARSGEKVIIPMNMRDGSLICTGKGNPDWNYSAPHGSGRLMSRGKAMECIDMESFRHDMEGIATWSVCENTKDEAPAVYKPMASIIRQIQPTVSVDKIIRPVYNFKAHDSRDGR